MERSVLDSVRSIDGVEKASGQFYLTSLSESCCDFPIQIIGFEPDSDFVVQKWARKKIRTAFSEGNFLLCGSNVSCEQNSVRFFGQKYSVSAKLSKSGTGMDNVIFCDMRTLRSIFEDAVSKGFGFISDGDTDSKISTVLIRISPEASLDSVSMRIKNAVSDVQVIQGERFIITFSKKMSVVFVFMYALSALILVITIFSLAFVFSVTINERRREFSILRVLGADRKCLCSIMLREAAMLGAIGSAVGIAVASLVILPFNVLISEKISLPFAMSGIKKICLFIVVVFVLSTTSCLVASIGGAVRAARVEPYGDVK